MGQFNVSQRTKDGMFNATDLLRQYNKIAGVKRKLDNYFAVQGTTDLINEIVKRENLNTPKLVYLKKRGKHDGGTWMHPLLFVDFAMYVNATFRYDVLKFIADQLLEFRNDAGDNYIGLTNAVQRFEKIDYRQLAKGLNWIAFNEHKKGIRQTATQKELTHLNDVQKQLAFAIDMGYIRTFDELLNEMRRIYHLSNNQ